jgi:hypothetical protein
MSNYPPQPGRPQQGYPPPGYPQQPGPGWGPSSPPPRSGMGCLPQLLIGMGCLFVLLILACGGMLGVSYYYVQKSVVSDAATTVEITEQIAKIDVPRNMAPLGAINVRVPFSQQVAIRGAGYGSDNHKDSLMLLEMGDVFPPDVQKQLRQNFEQSLQEHGIKTGGDEKLRNREEYQKRFVIRGEPAVFTVTKGVTGEDNEPRVQIEGTFQGKNGPAILILNVNANDLSEEQALEMIQGIE